MLISLPENYNEKKLAAELNASGIEYMISEGILTVLNGDPAIAQSVLSAHDPTPTRAEKLAAMGLNETDEAIRLVQLQGDGAPSWAKDIVAAYLNRINSALG